MGFSTFHFTSGTALWTIWKQQAFLIQLGISRHLWRMLFLEPNYNYYYFILLMYYNLFWFYTVQDNSILDIAWGQHSALNISDAIEATVAMSTFYLFKICNWCNLDGISPQNKWSYSKMSMQYSVLPGEGDLPKVNSGSLSVPQPKLAWGTLVVSIQATVCQLVALGRVISFNTRGLKTMFS